jgi:hypothetical protein
VAIAIAHVSPQVRSACGTPYGWTSDMAPLSHVGASNPYREPTSRPANIRRAPPAVCEFPAKNVEILQKSRGREVRAASKDPVARSHWQLVWLVAQRKPREQVAAVS